MPLNKDTVRQLGTLARIHLEEQELKILSVQLKAILDFIDKLKEVDIENISPTSHILPINNVLREDVPGDSLPKEKFLNNAPQKEGDFFGVPKVIE
ncbi:MAG: Asp-tRNA(Asn)/Glu-tRNA(Gln) amidotransferase subunit GatC [Candidatus Omnitrophica bacterium]|nr:Asp-tRNA(Asn)/Glu-tRNA(Gln) amidotransferase subunit GatC [Candidatus Omnitrophota bacterium]